MGEPTTVLPQSQILSYVTTISTPTRVRRVAHIGLRFTALQHLLITMIITAITVQSYVATGLGIRELSFYLMRDYKPSLFFFTLSLGCAAAQYFLGPAVEAGNKLACRLLPVTLFPNAFVFFVSPFAVVGWGVNYAHGFLEGAICLLLFLASAVLLLLIVDLSRFLKWIADQPAAEKPPTPFLS